MPLAETDLPILLSEADVAAKRLRRKLSLSEADQDDLRQDLLLDLIRRLPAFDPARGSLGAFAGVVLRNRATIIAARVLRERRATGGPLLSLDALSGDAAGIGDRLSEDDGLANWHGRPSADAVVEQRIHLGAALDRLDCRDRALCRALVHQSVEEVAARGVGSRAGLYRRLRALRFELTAYGLEVA